MLFPGFALQKYEYKIMQEIQHTQRQHPTKALNPFCAGTALILCLCKHWLDPCQPPSNSAAGLRSDLFATQSIIPRQN